MNILSKRWLYIVNAFIILLMTGVALAWSVFVGPLESAFGWSRASTSFAFTINVLCFPLGSFIAGYLVKVLPRYSRYKIILRSGAVMMALGFFLSIFVSEVWQIFLTYGVLTGTGIGLTYNAIVSTAPLWFPEKTGMVTGLLLMGYALSTSLLGTICQMIINVSDFKIAFLVLSISIIIVIMIGSFFVVTPTHKQYEMLPKSTAQGNTGDKDYTPAQMMKTKTFWVFFLFMIAMTGSGLALMNHAPVAMVETIGVSSTMGALTLSIMSICNGAGRLIWGTLFDKLGLNLSIKMIAIIFVSAMAVILLALETKVTYLYMLGACAYLFAYGGAAALSPVVTRNIFGNKNFSLNFSIMGMMCFVTSFFATVVGTIQTVTHTYIIAFIFLMVMNVIGLVLGFMFKEKVE